MAFLLNNFSQKLKSLLKLLFICFCTMGTTVLVLLALKGHPLGNLLHLACSDKTISLLEDARYHLLCPDGRSPDHRPCLCYYDSTDASLSPSLPDVASMNDTSLILLLRGRCAITVNAIGRLGNLMGEYATIYGLAQINRRPAFMPKAMAVVLRRYYKGLTLPVLDEHLEQAAGMWRHLPLKYWMEPEYANLNGTFLKVVGYPYSWTYFHHLRDEIVSEFKFGPEVVESVQRKLLEVRGQRQSITYVGVHARRSDYLNVFNTSDNRGVVADSDFFRQATDYFRGRFPDAVFVVASDDMPWCRENLDNSLGDVYFVGSGDIANPIADMALLASCNHSIITIGTYGFWTAYLAGGETVHLTNYSKPGVYYDTVVPPGKLYLPEWIPIAANRSSIL